MRARARRNSGRGLPREEREAFPRRLDRIIDKTGEKLGNEKVAKMTDFWDDQVQTSEQNSSRSTGQESTPVVNDTTLTGQCKLNADKKVGKDWGRANSENTTLTAMELDTDIQGYVSSGPNIVNETKQSERQTSQTGCYTSLASTDKHKTKEISTPTESIQDTNNSMTEDRDKESEPGNSLQLSTAGNTDESSDNNVYGNQTHERYDGHTKDMNIDGNDSDITKNVPRLQTKRYGQLKGTNCAPKCDSEDDEEQKTVWNLYDTEEDSTDGINQMQSTNNTFNSNPEIHRNNTEVKIKKEMIDNATEKLVESLLSEDDEDSNCTLSGTNQHFTAEATQNQTDSSYDTDMEVDSLSSTDVENEQTEKRAIPTLDSNLAKRKAVETNSQTHQKRLQVDNRDERKKKSSDDNTGVNSPTTYTKGILKRSTKVQTTLPVKTVAMKSTNNLVAVRSVPNGSKSEQINKTALERKNARTESDEEWEQISIKLKTHTSQNKREQTFRKGNKKVTIFCTIESTHTINSIKFTDPMKEYLVNHNIWIKPDLYATKVVSSPGFMTLIHPRLTNKANLIKELTNVLQQTKVDNTDEICRAWRDRNPWKIPEFGTPTPTFHLETTLRKWGDIKVEVISIHCSQEDAQYLKCLLVEAGSQDLFPKGIFVPTGIHLIEGKEVLRELLQEQVAFLQSVTSIQIAGISIDEMYYTEEQGENIEQFLLTCPGVKEIEQTHLTGLRGQWNIVAYKDKVHEIGQFIKTHVSRIYSKKKRTNVKLVNNQSKEGPQGHRIILIDNTLTRVGTYADALRRRFPNIGNNDAMKVATTKEPIASNTSQQNKRVTSQASIQNASPKAKENIGIKQTGSTVQENTDNLRVMDDAELGAKEQTHSTQMDFAMETQEDATIKQMETQIDRLLQRKMAEMQQINQAIMTSIQNSINEKVDVILEKKLNKVTNLMANKVTHKILRAINNKMNNQSENIEEDDTEIEPITQELSPGGTDFSNSRKPVAKWNSPEVKNKTQYDMLNELNQIETNLQKNNDSPHDVTNTESFLTQR